MIEATYFSLLSFKIFMSLDTICQHTFAPTRKWNVKNKFATTSARLILRALISSMAAISAVNFTSYVIHKFICTRLRILENAKQLHVFPCDTIRSIARHSNTLRGMILAHLALASMWLVPSSFKLSLFYSTSKHEARERNM